MEITAVLPSDVLHTDVMSSLQAHGVFVSALRSESWAMLTLAACAEVIWKRGELVAIYFVLNVCNV